MKSCPNCQNSYPSEFMVCPQDGTALVEAGAWADGTVVRGKYRIQNKIGQGGMGVVYKALHVAFDELRALKVMHPSLLSDESFVKRFRHEAVITRRLQHPNAVRVDDIDEAEDGRPFIVMEYIEGRSLKSIIFDEGAMPVERVCSISKQVAAALDAAHQLGMIHRDIKPENIVLLGSPPHEQTKVLDFGIAKIKEARLAEGSGMTLTGAGVVVGTPQYMSPEQAMGRRGDELDGRSDLYSLGVVMYQMLSGELPFHADTTMEMLIAHMQKPPTPLELAHPGLRIPEEMANLVMRLLEKNPAMRPANARELIKELEEVQKAPPRLNVTRVSAPEKVYSPEAAARAVRESLDAGMKSGPRHAPPRNLEPPPPPAPAREPEAALPPRVARPAPAPAHAPITAQPPKPSSRAWLVWVAIAVLAAALGGGFWFITNQRKAAASEEQSTPPVSAPVQEAQPAATPQTSPGNSSSPSPPVEPSGSEAAGNSQSENPQGQPQGAPPPATPRQVERAVKRPVTKLAGREQRAEETASRPTEESAPAAPAPDIKAVKAAIAMGDLYYDRGDYNSAIGEYQKGLRADPTNSILQNKIQAAKRARAAEERLLH